MSYRHSAAELDLLQGERERHRRGRDQHQDPERVHVGQGGRLRLRMGVSEDEASWVVTTYLVANARLTRRHGPTAYAADRGVPAGRRTATTIRSAQTSGRPVFPTPTSKPLHRQLRTSNLDKVSNGLS